MLIEERIDRVLSKHGPYPQDVWVDDDGDIHLTISGDWKHDHLFTKHLMFQMGYTVVREDIEQSDTDYYTAHYVFEDASYKEGLR